ncbi:flagellar hook-basal body complex protein FliE [bacterium]|nr:flagellar hook-basal body complex protein FliE [bacterium]
MQNTFSIQSIGSLNQAPQNSQIAPTSSVSSISSGISSISAPTESDAKSFSSMLGDALSNVNSTMEYANTCTDKLLDGSLNNIHELTIAGAKSEVMLHLTTQVASKLCSSATTLFQMQL